MSSDHHLHDLRVEVDRLRLELQSFKAKSESGEAPISIGNYLLTRLAQLGVTVRISFPFVDSLSTNVSLSGHVRAARRL